MDLAGPDRTRTVSSTVSVPGHKGKGLLIPIAVVAVLLAAAFQVRLLLGRASALATGDADPPD